MSKIIPLTSHKSSILLRSCLQDDSLYLICQADQRLEEGQGFAACTPSWRGPSSRHPRSCSRSLLLRGHLTGEPVQVVFRPFQVQSLIQAEACLLPLPRDCAHELGPFCRRRLAAATSERTILVFDASGNKIDKFKTRPADASSPTAAYSLRGLLWSADSTVLVVAQSDGAVFGYRLGTFDAKDKKTICTKIATGSPPTCLCWLPGASQPSLVFGCINGKVWKSVQDH